MHNNGSDFVDHEFEARKGFHKPLSPGTVDPPVQYVQIISIEQAKDVAHYLAAQGY
jgi:hypothetical protein